MTLKKGSGKILEYLNGSNRHEMLGAMEVIDNFCAMNYNIRIIPEKYDWGLSVIFCGSDNAVHVLDTECYDRIASLYKDHDANLGLRYNYQADLNSIHDYARTNFRQSG